MIRTVIPAWKALLYRLIGRRAFLLFFIGIGLLGIINITEGSTIKIKAIAAQVLLEHAWTKTLNGEQQVKPWPWADIWPILQVSIPHLNHKSMVLAGVSGQALAFGPGWMTNTPAPGMPGLSIIAAHRDTHFHILEKIRIGDHVTVTNTDGVELSFVIEETRIVNTQKSDLYTEGDIPKIALVTCWPFNATQQGHERFVAIGRLVTNS